MIQNSGPSGSLPIADVLKKVVKSYDEVGSSGGHKYVSLNYLTGEVDAGSRWNRASLAKITQLVQAALSSTDASVNREEILQNYAVIVKKIQDKQETMWSKIFGKDSQVAGAIKFINKSPVAQKVQDSKSQVGGTTAETARYNDLIDRYNKSLNLTKATEKCLSEFIKKNWITKEEASGARSFVQFGLLVSDKSKKLSDSEKLCFVEAFTSFIDELSKKYITEQTQPLTPSHLKEKNSLKKSFFSQGLASAGSMLASAGETIADLGRQAHLLDPIKSREEILNKLDEFLIAAHKG